MTPFPVITAHGLALDGRTGPTHAACDRFEAWAAGSLQLGFAFEPLARSAFIPTASISLKDPSRSIYLTCDDALASVLDMAERIHGPATLFVATDYVGKTNQWPYQPAWVPVERCLDWSEIRHLAAQGWAIAAHSCSHLSFNHLSESEIAYEIQKSVDTIEKHIGKACHFFAYPYGHAPRRAQKVVERCNLIAFGTSPGWVATGSNRFNLPRLDLYDLLKLGRSSAWAWHKPHQLQIQTLKTRRFASQLLNGVLAQ